MKHSLNIRILIVLIAGFASACAGGRQKQAVAVQPAPGSTQPAGGANGEQQTQQGGDQGFPGGEGEQANPNGGDQLGDVPAGENGQGTNTNPGTGGQSNGTTTDLIIEATLEDSSSVASDVAWDGKSFKGSGKWTVTPMP